MKKQLSKATLDYTDNVSIDGGDVEFASTLEILPHARLDGDYKITISVRRSHGEGELTDQAILKLIHKAQEEGRQVLDEYFGKDGRQLTLRFAAADRADNEKEDAAPRASRRKKGELDLEGEAAAN